MAAGLITNAAMGVSLSLANPIRRRELIKSDLETPR